MQQTDITDILHLTWPILGISVEMKQGKSRCFYIAFM